MVIRYTRQKRNGETLFFQLVILFFIQSVCVQGGMYLFSYSYKGNYAILAFIFTAIIFKWDYLFQQKKIKKNSRWE